MKIQKFTDLEEKIEKLVQEHQSIKQDKEKIESRLAYKNKESEDVRRHLETILKQKEVLKKKLDGIIDKIASLTIT